MNISALRNRVTIQTKAAGRDNYGAEVDGWVDLTTAWASVEPLRGREFFAAQQVNSEVTTLIRMRYRSDVEIRPEMRVIWQGHTYDINTVIDVDSRHEELQLMCTEVL